MPVEPEILRFFEYEHLPVNLRSVSSRFYQLAHAMTYEVADSAEKSAGLRKLLEAKDCFVRAALPAPCRRNTDAACVCVNCYQEV